MLFAGIPTRLLDNFLHIHIYVYIHSIEVMMQEYRRNIRIPETG